MKSDKVSILLKEKRESAGLSYESVSEYLNKRKIKITPIDLYNIEKTHDFRSHIILSALCDLYDVRDPYHDASWHSSEYEDFFNTTTTAEKIYLLKKWGIPNYSSEQFLPNQLKQLTSAIQLIA